MSQISAKLAELLLGSGDHSGNLGPLVGQRRHDVTFRHIHPRSQNDRGDYLLQADMMSAMRLVLMRHDTAKLDPMFRSALDALDVLAKMKHAGISLHMIDLGGDVTNNGVSKLVLTILSAVAEAE